MKLKTECKSLNPLSFLQALFLLFLGLKLTNQIDWPWWFVAMPCYFPLVIGVLIKTMAIIIENMKDAQ